MMVFLKGNDGSDGQNGTQVCHLDPKLNGNNKAIKKLILKVLKPCMGY